MNDIIKARYPSNEWNIYGAQASDGDNWHQDSGRAASCWPTTCCPRCATTPTCRSPRPSRTCGRNTPSSSESHKNFAMRKVADAQDIYPVFRELFKKERGPA